MRLATFLAVSSLLPIAQAAAADTAAQTVSFRDLFGLEQAQAIETLGTDVANCFSRALEDFNLALAGKDPVNSKTDMSSYPPDGGTVVWRSDCYNLAVLKSLTSYQLPDGSWIHGHVQGPSLSFKLGPKTAQSSPIARTRFVFAQKLTPNTSLERTRER
jgi:hypothetical protein